LLLPAIVSAGRPDAGVDSKLALRFTDAGRSNDPSVQRHTSAAPHRLLPTGFLIGADVTTVPACCAVRN
jgi:hypothetical protein